MVLAIAKSQPRETNFYLFTEKYLTGPKALSKEGYSDYGGKLVRNNYTIQVNNNSIMWCNKN